MPGRMDRPQSRGAFYGKVAEKDFEKTMALHSFWEDGQRKKRLRWWQKLWKKIRG